MRITPTHAVICVHYQHALVPNLDFDSGAALNKLWALSHDSNSANARHSFIFCYSPGLQDHVSLTPALTFACLGTNACRRQQDWWTGFQLSSALWSMIVSDICCQSDCIIMIKDTGRNYKMGYLCSKKQCFLYFIVRLSSVLLVMRSQSTSMMLEKGLSRYP